MRIRRVSGGFTLVEVALALLVVSVGILGAFSLFPSGLAASKEAVSETQAACFAQMVFDSVRASASREGIAAATTTGKTFNLQINTKTSGGAVDSSSSGAVQISATAQTYLLKTQVSGTAVDEVALTYRLTAPAAANNYMRRLYLEIWPSQYVNVNNQAPTFTFYTDLFNVFP